MWIMVSFLLFLICALAVPHSSAFRPVYYHSFSRFSKSTTVTMAIINYPVKTSNVLTKMTQSTQKALQDRTSRMEIELPPGSDFGVEASSKQGSKRGGNNESQSPTDKLKRANREAARLVADMFSSISSSTVALFPSEGEASDARVKWGPTFRGQLYSIDAPAPSKAFGNLYSKRVSKQEQEQALLGSDGIYIPDKTDLVIIAGPRLKDLKKLKKVSDRLGEGTAIILINARASIEAGLAKTTTSTVNDEDDNDWISSSFIPVFHYAPPLLDKSFASERDLLLYHEYGGPWYLAEKEKTEEKGLLGSIGGMLGGAGSFKTLWEGKNRPSAVEMKDILSGVSS